jgi:mono/diheme cytochrome c family protein
MRFLVGLLLGLVLWPAALWFYLHSGHPPVAVADNPLPLERSLVRIPLKRRIAAEMPKSAPIPVTPENLLAGAQIYKMNCAGCHGAPNDPSEIAQHIFPHAPQLWKQHGDHVGVSDDPPGATYWIVSNGVRLSGMPSFNQMLKPEQIWQVSLLLANADKQLPPQVTTVLNQP